MTHDHRTQTFLRPLSIDFTTTPQFNARSPLLTASGDPGSGIPRVAPPGGASVRMKDSAGTSMALNLDIHPVYGTPLLSGQAITAQGDVLEVHPCSCNNPIASRHNLPMTASPEPSRDKLLFRDSNDSYPTPHSRIHKMPGSGRTRTPLVLVQTQLPSPPHATELLQELEIPVAAPGAGADIGSPITPTPFSVQCNAQGSSTGATYYTTQEYSEEPSIPPTAPNAGTPSPLGPSSSQHDEPPSLGRMPTQSTFNPDLEMPTVSSPSSIGPFSGISEPSAIGPLPSLPSPSSVSSPEHSPCTVLAFSRLASDLLQDRTPTASNFYRPSSRGSASQGGRVASVAEVTLPEPPEDSVHVANDNTAGTHDMPITTGIVTEPVDPSESKTGSTSDLYTNRIAVKIPMPSARIGPEGDGLRYDLAAESEPRPGMNGLAGPSPSRRAPRMGKIKGTWIANQERDHVALKLDLTLIKLGFQNPSMSMLQESPSRLARPSARLWPHTPESEGSSAALESTNSYSIESMGSCPSTISTLSELPLTPIPELLHTPTRPSTLFAGASTIPGPPLSHARAHSSEKQRNLVSRLPAPLDNGPILAQLVQGEHDVGTIQTALRRLANEWQNAEMMPNGVALRDIDDDCTALYHALLDLSPIIMLTWPPGRHVSLDTEGRQPPAREQQLHLEHMGEREHKWYLKQHEFTTSLQRNLSRLTHLARRVVEDPDAAYRGNVLERISQFMEKFEDLALRLKLAHHIRVEQRCRARVRHAARRAVTSPEQVSAYEYHKANLAKVRQDIEGIAHDAWSRQQWR